MAAITIIGGSGFIGTRLAKRLSSSGGDFRIIDKRPSSSFPEVTDLADVRSKDQLLAAVKPGSMIVNLAAEHRDDVTPTSLYYDVNVEGAKNICDVARERNVDTLVFTSTVAIYGFAPIGTSESCPSKPFNDYGISKKQAEDVFCRWQAEAAGRTLVIIRPTVVFGEQNRGNVYNLLRQIAVGKFVMIGSGLNRKSMAYVENVAAFIEYSLQLGPGVHTFNYVDKPDFTMNELVDAVRLELRGPRTGRTLRLPYALGYGIGLCFDLFGKITRRKFRVSAIRVKKFCSDSVYATAVDRTDFTRPVSLLDAIRRTVRFEFIESHSRSAVFYSE